MGAPGPSLPHAGTDPLGYLRRLAEVVADRAIDVVLPTHEQAWLLAAGQALLPSAVRVAVADFSAFRRVQSKLAFAGLLDELGLPQPRWRPVETGDDLSDLPFPYWLKTAFSTAGQGVRQVVDARSRDDALRILLGSEAGPVMAQQPARGQYGQVQGLFDHGRLVAVHTSVQTGVGMGGSAAARLGVDHPAPRGHMAALGEALGWQGGITLDYLHEDGRPTFIECNPRTVEPGNAAASGVNIPDLQVRLTLRARAAFACSSGPAWRPHTRNHRAAVGSGQSKPLASLGARADLWLARPSRRLRPQQRAADPSDQGSAQPPSRRVRPRAPAPVAGASGRPLFSNRSGVLHSAFGSGAGRRRVTWLLTLWRAKVLSLSSHPRQPGLLQLGALCRLDDEAEGVALDEKRWFRGQRD